MTGTAWAPKGAGEIDWRGLDWKSELATGETIVTFGFDLPDGATVSKVSQNQEGSQTVVKFAGGTAGTVIDVLGWITTTENPRRLEYHRTLRITP